MKRILILTFVAVSLLTACAVVPAGRHGHRSGGVVVAPVLPSVVILGTEPFYFYSEFHYHYARDGWYYSKSRSGPWFKLPRNRYPKEVKFKGKKGKYHKNRDKYQRDRYSDDDYRRYRDSDNDNHRSGGVVVAPVLPSVVILGTEPFYFYSEFHYHYARDGWYYSKSRSGPWFKLPRNRYPKEVKFKGKKGKYHKNRDKYRRDRYSDDDYLRDRYSDNDNQR